MRKHGLIIGCLVLVLLFAGMTSALGCSTNSVGYGVSAAYGENEKGEWLPHLEGEAQVQSDMSGHRYQVRMDVLINGRLIATFGGVNDVSGELWFSEEPGDVVLVFSGYCDVCHHLMDDCVVGDDVWNNSRGAASN